MTIALFSPFVALHAQGCVAIRSCLGGGNIGSGASLLQGQVELGVNYRYFKSFRHFRGSHEEVHRVEEGTQVINHSHFVDLALNYGITERWYANFILPVVFHGRSSMYEHGGNPPNGLGERHITRSSGLGDMRLGIGYWLLNPEKHHRLNYAVSLGVKLPTGKYDYTDLFYNQGEDRDQNIEKVVDQSIQPGDGGLGFTLDVQGYQALSERAILTTNLYYLFNFQETNGVLTRNGQSEFSCPDQYAFRLGIFYTSLAKGLSPYLGGRIEGVPSSDLIGGSAGYRRPGYAVSVEPGINYSVGAASFNLSVPIAISRNRTQSYQDIERTNSTGIYRHGDAAFADYLINFNFAYRFGGKAPAMDSHTPSLFEKAKGKQ